MCCVKHVTHCSLVWRCRLSYSCFRGEGSLMIDSNDQLDTTGELRSATVHTRLAYGGLSDGFNSCGKIHPKYGWYLPVQPKRKDSGEGALASLSTLCAASAVTDATALRTFTAIGTSFSGFQHKLNIRHSLRPLRPSALQQGS